MKDKKRIIVKQKYRKNPLSYTDGGVTVAVELEDIILLYENIKYPDGYIRKISKYDKYKNAKIYVL